MSTLRTVVIGLLAVGLVAGGRPAPGLAVATGNPLKLTSGFYVDPDSSAASYVRRHPGATEIKTKIADQAGARWFGRTSGDVKQAVTAYTAAADRLDKLPVLVAGNISGRDCGGRWSGGAESPSAYRTWISQFSDGIGARPAIVVIEPDALARLDCLPAKDRPARIALLKYAANQFATQNPNTWAYMDAGTATTLETKEMARRLRLVDIGKIRGFALNTSNYYTTEESAAKGTAIKAALGGAGEFVIDTSRNGNGSNGTWCNPTGRKLGAPTQVGAAPDESTPTTSTPADLLLWLTTPGTSDGLCGLTPTVPLGTFSPVLATHLITGT
ncbi:glycoside hydrolase family 6 protein [Kribbella sp. NPDC050241]|uniref:glycoside hydrolase family 6 protein n=1 Tax=Kribbella sp. NPDC050241 TaxID=3364115 RepID=UPI003794A6AA